MTTTIDYVWMYCHECDEDYLIFDGDQEDGCMFCGSELEDIIN